MPSSLRLQIYGLGGCAGSTPVSKDPLGLDAGTGMAVEKCPPYEQQFWDPLLGADQELPRKSTVLQRLDEVPRSWMTNYIKSPTSFFSPSEDNPPSIG